MSLGDKFLDVSLRKLIRHGMRILGRGGVNLADYHHMAALLGEEQLARIAQMPRFTAGEVSFGGLSLVFNDNVSLLGMCDEIFVRKNYEFTADTNAPVIIDCGANIGMGVAYFKMRYPQAIIHAFEPDEGAYQCLAENVKRNRFEQVHLHNKAVWVADEALEFYADGSWGGGIFSTSGTIKRKVQAVDIAHYLDRKIDLLKIDIEGAETKVIQHAAPQILQHVDRLFFEWHSVKGTKQQLSELLTLFEASNFRYHMKEAAPQASPFATTPSGPMDSQLDVFIKRV